MPSKGIKEYIPQYQKFFICINENTTFSDVIKRPFFKKFAECGTLLSNYHGTHHPSQPNYLSLVSGTNTFNRVMTNNDEKIHENYTITNNSNIKIYNQGIMHLGDLLDLKDITWRVYMESYPGAFETCSDSACPSKDAVRTLTTQNCSRCFRFGSDRANFDALGGNVRCSCNGGSRTVKGFQSHSEYVRYHNPFASFANVIDNPERCIKHFAPSSQLYSDIDNGCLAQVSFYIPNMYNNAHNTDIDYCDEAMERTFLPLLKNFNFTKRGQRSPIL